ncbi:SAC3/GANP/Nin1/mts3/eIF-3 p25 family-domain-containing protein [Armillaria luteobubalina]|uniref:SAC3/GANP/Nin1/mts3/eIF-3 p25 family-domain-containing protein n=1 Tax=Armillaria luteobubalina TaxID=153913 RepID=A0AA39PE51_9AGAR|nr:SAC3/GANP/Nin1/mts3/eIF-3 p25 family-domain-containing protein [Armillaria luteobubalina]
MSSNLLSLYEDLQRSFNSIPSDTKRCGTLLSQLKIGLIEAGLLIPQGEPIQRDLVIARDILEIGAIWSIRSRDEPSFDRYFSQLQTFYNDYRCVLLPAHFSASSRSISSYLPPSKREFPIRGLNLIRLLTQNRIADFHTTLESLPLPADAIGDNPYISHPVNLERWLMEGSYSKVWNARAEAPAEEYKYFVDSLIGTIRNEIASCEESAYNSLPLKDAALLLFFASQSELLAFAQQRGWEIDLTGATITFARKGEEQLEIPRQKLIAASLAYARELEQIV